jgi:Tfp pilus assembly protein PilF
MEVNELNNRGVEYASDGAFDLAIAYYSAAIKIDPEFSLAFVNRARAYVAKGDYTHALEDFDLAILGKETQVFSPPQRAAAHNERGAVLVQMGEYDKAISDLDAAVRINRAFHGAYHNRAVALLRLGRLAEALVDVDRALWIFPEFADAYITRATIYAASGRSSEASVDLERAAEISKLAQSTGVLRTSLYPPDTGACTESSKHLVMLSISDGKVTAYPKYAGVDAHISIQDDDNRISFRLGNEGCRIEVTVGKDAGGAVAKSTEPNSGRQWMVVPRGADAAGYEKILYKSESGACANAKVRVRAFWGYVDFRNEDLSPDSAYSGIGTLYRYGGEGCKVVVRAG